MEQNRRPKTGVRINMRWRIKVTDDWNLRTASLSRAVSRIMFTQPPFDFFNVKESTS